MTVFTSAELTLFFVASVAVIATPGPAVVFICARSAELGVRAGLATAASIAVGNAAHALTAAFGVAAIVASSQWSYWAVKLAGAGYLVYLGVKRLAGRGGIRAVGDAAREPAAVGGSAFREGLLVGLLNPKVALFLVAFLPQFADPERGTLWAQMLALGMAFTAMGLVGDASYALVSGRLGAALKRNRRERWTTIGRILSGMILIGLGLATALSGR